jgi:hypothetical protein
MDFSIFLDQASNIGKKIFNAVKDNVKVNLDVSVDTPFTEKKDYHVSSDQIADKLENMIWDEQSNKKIIHPVYFMNEEEVKRIQDEANKRT